MKYKHILSVVLLGILVYGFGVWAKVLHKPFADSSLTAGFVIGGLGLLLLIIKILMSKGRLNK